MAPHPVGRKGLEHPLEHVDALLEPLDALADIDGCGAATLEVLQRAREPVGGEEPLPAPDGLSDVVLVRLVRSLGSLLGA